MQKHGYVWVWPGDKDLANSDPNTGPALGPE